MDRACPQVANILLKGASVARNLCFVRCLLSLLIALALLTGCPAEPPAGVPAGAPSTPAAAQPRLPTVKLYIGTNELVAEIARTPAQMGAGMMFRPSMAENEAMIFVYPAPQRVSFYMRNTTVPLSCAYLDSAGVIREIYDMQPLDETSIPSVSDQIRYCLEVPQGWFGRHGVGLGAVVGSQHGTLDQTFFRRR
jgi:uncharacterized membrane protein (UPF0127 family)